MVFIAKGYGNHIYNTSHPFTLQRSWPLRFRCKPFYHTVKRLDTFCFASWVFAPRKGKEKRQAYLASVLLIRYAFCASKEAPTKMSRMEYIAFYRSLLAEANDRIHLERMNNAVGQLVLKLVNLDQLVVHADSGDVILLFMNIGLACDYRIVADNTIFQNPNIDLDVIPRGGGVFFLSKMRGEAVASKVLLSGKDVEASQACHLGIVDEVVPKKRLHQAALKTALRFAAMPKGYVTGIKKLLQFNYRELPDFLEFENEYLRKRYAITRQAG
jgi:enoyl-CoA hydratase/carnithine racemase